MSELIRMCECGGRTLLKGETLCPSCQRTHKSVGWQLHEAKSKVESAGTAAGQAGVALIGKVIEQAKVGAQVAEQTAAPLMQAGVDVAKTHGVKALKTALGHAEIGGEKVLRAAMPFAERLLQRTKAYLDKKSP